VTQELALARRIGQQLDRARRADAVEPDQIRKARDEARAVARRVGEQRLFAATYDDPLEVDAPGLHGLRLEAEHRERQPQLGRPAEGIAVRAAFPHAVPGEVLL